MSRWYVAGLLRKPKAMTFHTPSLCWQVAAAARLCYRPTNIKAIADSPTAPKKVGDVSYTFLLRHWHWDMRVRRPLSRVVAAVFGCPPFPLSQPGLTGASSDHGGSSAGSRRRRFHFSRAARHAKELCSSLSICWRSATLAASDCCFSSWRLMTSAR